VLFRSSSSTLIHLANPLSDFSMVPNSTIVPVDTSAGSGTDTINLASVNGFSGAVNLACTPASGVTCSISPASAGLASGGSGTATLTVNVPATTAEGNYNVVITGQDAATGQYIHTLAIQTVVTGSTPGFTLANSGNLSLDAGINTSNTATISVTPSGKFTGTVELSCAVTAPTGAISPATCGVPASVTISGLTAQTATLTVSTTSTTTGGAYTVTVTGTAGTMTETTVATATVSVPSFGMSNGGSVNIGTAGTSGTSAITVTPSYGFTGTVALSGAVTTSPSGAASLPTIAFATNPVVISGTAAQASTMTVSTTASTTPGTYAVTVTGAAAPDTATTVVAVTVGTPSFTLANTTTSASPLTIAATGETTGNATTITVTPSGGFTGTVSLTCAVTSSPTGASHLPSCGISPASLTNFSGSTPQSSTLTISTTAATALNKPMKLFWPTTGGAVLALAFFFGIPKRRRNWLAILGLLVLFVSVVGIGCGGAGSAGGGGFSNPGTTTGPYTVTVTATSGTATQTTAVYVNVQ
jgi:hypothetical protein